MCEEKGCDYEHRDKERVKEDKVMEKLRKSEEETKSETKEVRV